MEEERPRDRRSVDHNLLRMESKIDELIEALNGNPKKDIRGVRPRLAAAEEALNELNVAVKNEKVVARLKILEDLVDGFLDERKKYKAWIAGLSVGLGLTTVTSLGGFLLQLIRLAGGSP